MKLNPLCIGLVPPLLLRAVEEEEEGRASEEKAFDFVEKPPPPPPPPSSSDPNSITVELLGHAAILLDWANWANHTASHLCMQKLSVRGPMMG